MIGRSHVTAFVALAVALWAGLLALRGTPVSWDLLWPFGLVVGVASGAVAVFEKWGWAWPLVRNLLVKRPDLRGTWRGTLETDWNNGATSAPRDPIACFMVVKQTWTSIQLKQLTAESTSALVTGAIARVGDDEFVVAGVYDNWPNILLRQTRSPSHRGAIVLEPHGRPVSRLAGEYWTERSTRRRVELTERRKKRVTGCKEAEELFEGSGLAAKE